MDQENLQSPKNPYSWRCSSVNCKCLSHTALMDSVSKAIIPFKHKGTASRIQVCTMQLYKTCTITRYTSKAMRTSRSYHHFFQAVTFRSYVRKCGWGVDNSILYLKCLLWCHYPFPIGRALWHLRTHLWRHWWRNILLGHRHLKREHAIHERIRVHVWTHWCHCRQHAVAVGFITWWYIPGWRGNG